MSTTVYSMAQCGFCVDAKLLLNEKNIDFEEVVLGEDMTVEDFANQYPGIYTVPFVVYNGKQVNGYDELKEVLQ